jgi:hypothetical protein
MLRTILAYAVATAVTFVAASFAHTQMVLNELSALGAPVDAGVRFTTALSDMIGLLASGSPPGIFAIIIALGMLVAFPAAALTTYLAPNLRWLVFMVAGAAAMFVIFTALKSALGTVGLFGARGTMGLALQMGAGALGGLVFTILKARER